MANVDGLIDVDSEEDFQDLWFDYFMFSIPALFKAILLPFPALFKTI